AREDGTQVGDKHEALRVVDAPRRATDSVRGARLVVRIALKGRPIEPRRPRKGPAWREAGPLPSFLGASLEHVAAIVLSFRGLDVEAGAPGEFVEAGEDVFELFRRNQVSR